MNKSKIIKMLKNFKSRIFLFCSLASRNLPPTTYNLQPSPHHLPPKNGFAMLFSVLISSLLVVIGLSIFNITLKELSISTSSRESQIAFYAANSGMECALYWDLKENAFATSTDSDEITRVAPIVANCNTVDVNDSPTGNANSATTNFDFYVYGSSGSCANVKVEKKEVSGNKIETTITSQGENICGSSGRKVQRGLRASITRDM